MAAVTAVCGASVCWCIYPNRGEAAALAQTHPKWPLFITCLPPAQLWVCVIPTVSRRDGLQWGFHPSDDTRAGPPMCSLSGPPAISFPMQWHQGMVLPVLGLDFTPRASVTGASCSPSKISCKKQEPWWLKVSSSGHIGWNLFSGISGQCCAFQQPSKWFTDHTCWTALPNH